MVSPKVARVQLWEGSPGCSTVRGSLGRAWHTSWVKENKLRGRDFRVARAFRTSAWELTKVLETHRWSLISIRLILISSCRWGQERTNERMRRSSTRHKSRAFPPPRLENLMIHWDSRWNTQQNLASIMGNTKLQAKCCSSPVWQILKATSKRIKPFPSNLYMSQSKVQECS